MALNTSESQPSERLLSLDALRGFDMVWIVGAEEIVHALHKISNAGIPNFLANQLSHKDWDGFAFYDLIFPLFVFIAGVSLVFSLDRLMAREGTLGSCKRIFRRFLLLYLLGIIIYGGFSTPFKEIRLLGVLQRIALCYLFAGLIYCFFKLRGRIIICLSLLIGYWALMTFVPVPDHGAGNFAEGKNLANYVDQQWLPLRKWDGDHDPEGLLSTFPAIATCLLGTFAGMLLKSTQHLPMKKIGLLAVSGLCMLCVGWLWHLQFPVIKKIWTSSFVLVAGGYSCLLLAFFYWLIDIKQWRRWAQPFVWVGMNPIAIYVAFHLVDFKKIASLFVGGDINKYFGSFGPMVIALTALGLSLLFCRFLYQKKIFMRV